MQSSVSNTSWSLVVFAPSIGGPHQTVVFSVMVLEEKTMEITKKIMATVPTWSRVYKVSECPLKHITIHSFISTKLKPGACDPNTPMGIAIGGSERTGYPDHGARRDLKAPPTPEEWGAHYVRAHKLQAASYYSCKAEI